MTRIQILLIGALIALTAATTCACNEGGGIGMGVPSSGARWGGGTTNPGVIVGGGPVYR